MSITNIRVLLCVFVFFFMQFLFKCNVSAITQRKQNASRTKHNIFSETLAGTANTTAIAGDRETINNGVLQNILNPNLKPQENPEPNKIEELQSMRSRRQANDDANTGEYHTDEAGQDEPLAEGKKKGKTTKAPVGKTTPKKKRRRSKAHSIQSSLYVTSSVMCLLFIKPLMFCI